MFRTVLEIVAAACALLGTGLYLFSIAGAWRFGQRRPQAATGYPPISILKPLRGADPQAYDCFRSHCLQDYPEYEIIFGVHDPQDPAVAVVRRLQQEFPGRRIELVICERELGTNRKVSNLAQMLPAARFDHLLINDGDIRVPADYLRRVVAGFAEPRAGLVTALYRGIPGPTLWSNLEALGITDFAASVLVAYQHQRGFHYGFGSTLALPRRVLEGVGGFEALTDYLADDYQLATLVARAGCRVVLSEMMVETMLPGYTFRDFWAHQMRWARNVRDLSPRGNLGLGLAFGVQWAAVAVIAAGGASWAWGLFGFAYLARIAGLLATAVIAGQDPQIWRRVWMVPLRDVQAAAVWLAAYAGRTIQWRGEKFLLDSGKLRRML